MELSINQKLLKITEEDFNFLIKNGKRSSILLNFDFETIIYFSWGLIKEKLPELLTKGDLEQLFFLMLKERGINVFLIDVQRLELKEAISFYLWIVDELKSIRELESEYLRSDPDIKLMQAGINKLDKFGLLNTLDNLAKGDITKYDMIRSTPYNVIFDKQFLEITKADIEKKLSKIK